MATIKLFNYDYGNYNDQRVKNVTDLATEFPDVNAVIPPITGVNFSFNDGLMATIIVNIDDNLVERINYATVTHDNVIRPYYVLSYMYLLTGQYQFTLKLDTVLYNLEFIKNAKANVFRGFVPQSDNTIFNNEGIEVSKIKVGELPLRQLVDNYESNVGFYAVYMDRKLGSGSDAGDELKFRLTNADVTPNETYALLTDYPYHEYVNNRSLFFNLKETHVLQNFGQFKKAQLGLIQVWDYVPFNRVQCYKMDTNTISSYNGYQIENYYNSIPSRGIAYSLDGRRKRVSAYPDTVPDLRTETGELTSGDYLDARRLKTLISEGMAVSHADSSSPLPSKYYIANSNMYNVFKTKQTDIAAIQYNTTTVVTKKTLEQILGEFGKIIQIGSDYFRAEIETNIRYEDLLWANSNVNLTTFLTNKYINASTVEPLVNQIVDEVNVEIDSYTATNSVNVIPYVDPAYPRPSASYNHAIVNHLIETYEIKLVLTPITKISAGVPLNSYGGSTAPKLDEGVGEEPYKLLIFPYGDVNVLYDNTTKENQITESVVRNLISNLINDYPGSIYDVQKIPYAPIELSKYFVALPNGIIEADYEDGDNNEQFFIFDPVNSIPYVIGFNAFRSDGIVEVGYPSGFANASGNKKLDSVIKFANVVSPSHKSLFTYEFTKNNYKLDFVITMDLKPYTPYFNIDFKRDPSGLYYGDFNDGRGLNIAEDMSMTVFTDQFESYKRENYNYLNSFNSQQDFQLSVLDRQQRHEKSKNELSKEQDWVNYGVGAGVNAVGAAASVGIGLATGGISAAAGGMAGTKMGLNVISGAMTTHLDHAYRDRNLALEQGYAKDKLGMVQGQAREQFQMSLENIEARPNRLDKVSGITVMNRRQCYLAIYDTTSIEKERVREYFKYNGYNINKIDTLADYINFNTPMAFVKAMIIESNSSINNTMLQDINQRLSVGVYFMKGS